MYIWIGNNDIKLCIQYNQIEIFKLLKYTLNEQKNENINIKIIHTHVTKGVFFLYIVRLNGALKVSVYLVVWPETRHVAILNNKLDR